MLNSYADGVNLHSDGLPNEPKRSHLAALHRLLMAHADGIMAAPRPIRRTPLTPAGREWGGEPSTLTAFTLGPLTFLENSNGSPGTAAAAAAAAAWCNTSAFPFDTSSTRSKGLAAAAAGIGSEAGCAAACCALGEHACTMYEFYGVLQPGQQSKCWVGRPTAAQGRPPAHYASRSRTAGPPPSPPSPPSPPHGHGGATVVFNGTAYALPPYSIIVVGASGAVLYNTSDTGAAPVLARTFANATDTPLAWDCWSELDDLLLRTAAGPPARGVVSHAPAPLEQLAVTSDRTEYLLYSAELPTPAPDASNSSSSSNSNASHMRASAPAGSPLLTVSLAGRISNAYTVFADNTLVGSTETHTHSYGAHTYSVSGPMPASAKRLGILSMSLGMMSHVSRQGGMDYKGIVGSVTVNGADLTKPAAGWSHVAGLEGERRGAGAGNASLPWSACATGATAPLTWQKAEFRLPGRGLGGFDVNTTSVLLDAGGMGRGHFYLNGVDLGKYWLIEGPSKQPTQRYYHLPPSLLRFGGQANLLVLGEQLGAPRPGAVRVVFSTMQ